ncbi:hypothetical protein ACHQM5_011808 [Ranunculus cassubicifolius]
MEAFNAAAGLTPVVSVLERSRTEQSRKFSRITKASTTTSQSRITLNSGLTFLSSVISTGVAKALTYEEALGLGQSAMSPSSSSNDSFDIGGVIDSIVSFGTENIAVIIGGATLLSVPLVLSKILNNKPKAWGVESAKNAYAKLGEVGEAQLLDIRSPVDVKGAGRPDIRGLKKKVVSVVYKGEDKPGFLQKLSLKFKDPENTTLFILDKFDGSSELVAELVTANGFKAAYAIKDGAEGPRGWTNSGLPWIQPNKTFNFGSLGESLSDALGDGSSALPVTLGIAAASGLSLLAFTEVETILQLLGSAALVQFVGKKLLYAQDRKETLQQVDEYLNTKIAPKELVDEIKQIGKALLPEVKEEPVAAPTEMKAESAPAELEVNEAPVAAPAELKAESSPAEPPKPAGSLNGASRPLSPYPYYADFKPPASPSPSKP